MAAVFGSNPWLWALEVLFWQLCTSSPVQALCHAACLGWSIPGTHAASTWRASSAQPGSLHPSITQPWPRALVDGISSGGSPSVLRGLSYYTLLLACFAHCVCVLHACTPLCIDLAPAWRSEAEVSWGSNQVGEGWLVIGL